jgi:hypothetical protein
LTSMVAYAKQKHVGLLAYVYPSIPFEKNPSWLVRRQENDRYTYATLASRDFQDYLIRNLVAFQQRTGIVGYSFDYTWLNLPGSSSYAQWFGWRRVIESLREAVPAIVVDGRQSYQEYGPWSWLAGNYPHPTGNDEQPESFRPYPDLHFDRVSADRERFVDYWYRNYQFAPEEVIPGYATHQTERSKRVSPNNLTGDDTPVAEMMYTSYRRRDWDYLGYRYSFLSSIATGGWNNVVSMIPARDDEERRHFSAADKAWIREWIGWTAEHKEYLLHTRTILDQPAIGHVDGTSAIVGDHGYLFLFNPNYKQISADLCLDAAIGLDRGDKFLLREIYPQSGLVIGKPGAGVWSRGDMVPLPLDGTSATVLELVPVQPSVQPTLLNVAAATATSKAQPNAVLTGETLAITYAAGEPGTDREIGVLLPSDTKVSKLTVNGSPMKCIQNGRYVMTWVHFAGPRFAQAQEIALTQEPDSSFKGAFTVPKRVLSQLAERKKVWSIPWTQEDYETTWLAPERLLLFVQIADAKDTLPVTATLDGQPLPLTRAYSSVRADPSTFVGFYADLSKIMPDTQHRVTLQLPETARKRFQGIFFDNVEPQYTEEITPAEAPRE